MKQILTLLITLYSLAAFGQYPVSSINITIQNNPPVNTADWATTMPPLMIIAQAKLVQGKVPPRLEEGRILVLIKKDGSKICGSFTQQNAPLCNFNVATKAWSGAVAVGLLGNSCVLQPGTYELCVQFFSSYAPIEPLSAEVCKSFTIAGDKQITYSNPKNLAPAEGINITQQIAKLPMQLRWVQIVPPPPVNDIMYTVHVYAVQKGQSPVQAAKTNTPVFEKQVNTTQTIWQVPLEFTGSKETLTFVWHVQATDNKNKPYGRDHGISEPTVFHIINNNPGKDTLTDNNQVIYSAPQNIAPANGISITQQEGKQPMQLRWTQVTPPPPNRDLIYTVHVYAVEKGQSPVQAAKTNTPVFEKQVNTTQTTWQIPGEYASSEENKTFVWHVQATDNKNKPYGPGKGISEPSVFYIIHDSPVSRPRVPPCKDFKFNIEKISSPVQTVGCCYQVSITNNYNGLPVFGPKSFRIILNNAAIISATATPSGWNRIPPTVPPNTNSITWRKTSGYIPNGQTNLGNICFGNIIADPFYLKYEWLNVQGKVICRDSVQVGGCGVDSCKNNLVRNGGFVLASTAGPMPTPGASQNWTRGYGAPIVNTVPTEGCFEQGYIQLSGNKVNGQAVVQALDPGNKIIMGKKYKVSIAVKFQGNQNVLNYVKLRVIAFNGILPTSGVHPSPANNVAIIGRSGKILDCGDWSVRVFTIWTANKNFQNIAINAFTDENTASSILIDNVSICETDSASCDELMMDSQGNPIPPAGLQANDSNNSCFMESDESYTNGSLVDLYGYNGTFGMYETLNQNDCNSMGGVLPDAVTNYNCEDSLIAQGITITCDSIDRLVNSPLPPTDERIFTPTPIPPLTNQCDKGQNYPSSLNMAFNGRDIIYVHGLQLDHLIKRTALDTRALLNWPLNRSEFSPGGYYKQVAETNWAPHIAHCLTNANLKNRYFIASYNCSERAEVAVYNIMNQIREAMEYGTGVVADPTDPRGTKCFAREFVIVSHSTGGLVADLVLSISNMTKTNMPLQALYGNAGYISDRCKGHIALHSAMGGSNLAKLCVATGLPIMLNSIMVDLTPEYTYAHWGYFLNHVPKPVFTIAGGQPNSIEAHAFGLLLTVLGRPDLGSIAGVLGTNILPGTDDGVVNMESASGRNKFPLLPVSQFFTSHLAKAFDLGIPVDRSIPFYIDQKRLPGFFSIGSTPYLTQTGMVEPHLSIIGMHPPFHNHYTFIQSAAEHLQPTNGSYYANGDYGPMNMVGNANYEEQLVTNDLTPYNNGLINPAIINEMEESIRGKKVVFTWIKIIMKNGWPKIVPYNIEYYIWKRLYHNLRGIYYDVDYAYKYLFVN